MTRDARIIQVVATTVTAIFVSRVCGLAQSGKIASGGAQSTRNERSAS